jgi:hypothetical protein
MDENRDRSMTSNATVVARYDEAKRAADEQTLRSVVRTQGMLLLILGVLLLFGTLLGFIMLVVFVGEAIDDGGVAVVFVLFAFVMLVVPIAIGALGVRQLRRQVHLPEVAGHDHSHLRAVSCHRTAVGACSSDPCRGVGREGNER